MTCTQETTLNHYQTKSQNYRPILNLQQRHDTPSLETKQQKLNSTMEKHQHKVPL